MDKLFRSHSFRVLAARGGCGSHGLRPVPDLGQGVFANVPSALSWRHRPFSLDPAIYPQPGFWVGLKAMTLILPGPLWFAQVLRAITIFFILPGIGVLYVSNFA